MIKVLQIRETPLTKCAGVDANCQSLIELFDSDAEIQMLPTVNYTRHNVPILHQYYIDRKEVCDSIEKNKPDVIHIHGAYSFTLLVAVNCAKRYNLPIVFSPHFHPFWALNRPIMGRIFFQMITKPVLRDVSIVFTINSEDTAVFSKYHRNVIRIPHWSKFKIPDVPPKKNHKMILFVGRLDEANKGFEHLYQLQEGLYDIHCVGKENVCLRSDMTKHVGISDEELTKLYKEAALLVVPSRYEAFSYVTLEGLYNYTPVLLSDRVRIADYLNNVKGANVFRYHDYDDFCQKVKSSIGQEVDVERVECIFNKERMREQYRKAYKKAYQTKCE